MKRAKGGSVKFEKVTLKKMNFSGKVFLMLPYHIKAYDPRLKAVIQFWLYGDTEEEIRKLLKDRDNITKIEWIRQEIPDWEK